MVFWKNAVASLGMLATLCSVIPSKSGELKQVEQKSKVETTLEKKLQEEWNKPQKQVLNGQLGWTAKEVDISGSVSAFYKLPECFNFGLDGSLSGNGFEWKIGEKDFYYEGLPLLNYFRSLSNLSDTYQSSINLGGTSLGDFIDIFNSERGMLENDFFYGLYELRGDLEEIYSDQYSQEFLYELLRSMIAGDLDNFLEENNITEGQKKATEDAIEDLFGGLDHLFDQTASDDIIRSIMEGDPLNNINLKGKSLRTLVNLVEGLGNLMELQITDDYLHAKLNLEGKGKVDTAISFTQKVELGSQEWVFDHVVASKHQYSGKIFFNMDLKLTKGVSFSEFLDIDPLVILVYQISDFDINLKDVSLNSVFNMDIEKLESLAESFEISKSLKQNTYGLGIVYEKRKTYQERRQIFLDFKFKTKSKELQGSYNEFWKSIKEGRNRNLIYVFSEEQRDLFWYSATAGLELFEDNHNWYHQLVKSGGGKYQKGSKEIFNILPRLNLAAGVKKLAINPFMAVKTFPHSVLKAGAVLDIPYVAARVSLEHFLEDKYRSRLLSHSLNPALILTLDISTVLFDDDSNKKVLNSYINTEQIEASPKPGKQTKHDRVLRKLYSDLDGLLFNVQLTGPELLLRTVYGADNSFFVGGGYFSDMAENLHGVDLVIGYEDFLFKGRYGYTNQDNHYGHLANISAGGSIMDLFLIQFDLRALLLPETESRYQGIKYNQNDIQAAIKFIGFF